MLKKDNIKGVFQVELDGKLRDCKCTFGVAERLENEVFCRPIIHVLADVVNPEKPTFFFKDIVSTIYLGLRENNDTRFDYETIGEFVLQKGISEYLEFFTCFLTYAVSGKTELELVDEKSNQKKNMI